MPGSDTRDTARGQKRKRAEPQPATKADDIDSDGEVPQAPEDEEKFNRYYNPAQDPEQRRQVKRKSRALEREFNGRWSAAAVDVLGDDSDHVFQKSVMSYSRAMAKSSPRRSIARIMSSRT